MNRESGFTLVELLVATTVSALLLSGVLAATQSASRTAESQAADARRDERRARAAEILRADWQGRLRVDPNHEEVRKRPPGSTVLVLSTTGDGLAPDPRRSAREVIYTASEKGLVRREGRDQVALVTEAASIEFWDGVAWRNEARGPVRAVRLTSSNPAESIVIR